MRVFSGAMEPPALVETQTQPVETDPMTGLDQSARGRTTPALKLGLMFPLFWWQLEEREKVQCVCVRVCVRVSESSRAQLSS